ncbi:uncharacterized protein LOC127256565 isoform X2 [Andrographis paniculata]|uniref:uncharacterized protein LOC127256565 isoform X2 n=1 Tax=Andrographis paniculata TaxID=175694 RepID=UPI0021E7B592|nr:uncharacterized protein LOC127256565 isoform X2 [Andrographis paniculata]
MAPRRRRISALPSTSPISIGNCEVTVEAKNFTSESDKDTVQIILSKSSKIRISVVEKENEQHDFGAQAAQPNQYGDCYFLLANPKDSDDQTKCLLQEVLALYMNELPAMNYAANTGKRSMFLERCVTNGKYCTLLLKSKNDKESEEVIGAITYQIIPADTQYAEIPLAAVSSNFQCKGFGQLLYLELRRRLQSVGICSIFCWGDRESEGFWLKQGFKGIGEVDKKGRAHRLPIKADVRKALCFPGGSTLMVSHLLKDNLLEPIKFLKRCLPLKSPELNYENQMDYAPQNPETPKEANKRPQDESFESELLPVNGCQKLGPLPIGGGVANTLEMRGGNEDDDDNYRPLLENKKRIWEASLTSLKSKKVKGTNSCSNSMQEKGNECRTGNITNEDFGYTEIPSAAKCCRIMLMNIADEDKKSCLTKIIEDLGGVVASEGNECTHVVTGKARKTLNFCTALCSGAWVIVPGWLKESFKKGKFVDETPFFLVDEDYRIKCKMELKDAVFRAKAAPNALLKGLDIWLAKHVQPPAITLSAIVKAAGGNVIRTQDEVKDTSKTIFLACEEDMDEALLAAKLGIWTFSSDWLLNCVMRQELDFDAPKFAESL